MTKLRVLVLCFSYFLGDCIGYVKLYKTVNISSHYWGWHLCHCISMDERKWFIHGNSVKHMICHKHDVLCMH
jgi:hypothetical protein